MVSDENSQLLSFAHCRVGVLQDFRVLLADDQALLRSAFKVLLASEPDMEVVGEAADGFEAINQVQALRPDVVLMDIRMTRLDGLDATRAIVGDAGLATARVLVLTTFGCARSSAAGRGRL